MQSIDLWAFGSFVIATTFTPGPNNITCASLGWSGIYPVAGFSDA
ncbi:MAG: hypothetical protein U9R40_04595 [Synergistota bacterium]|nr:hypothetical protein [Synergistota bacterium]